MRIFHDWEFLELGPEEPLRPLSVGMVREDGAEYYAVVREQGLWTAVYEHHPWLVENVMPYLPVMRTDGGWLSRDDDHPDAHAVRERALVAAEVRQFVLGEGAYPYREDWEGYIREAGDADVELWGWYSAYDHVCLAQLFGTMAQLPRGIPLYTHDLKQEVDRLGMTGLPELPDDLYGPRHEHHALWDAREIAWRFAHLGQWYDPSQHHGAAYGMIPGAELPYTGSRLLEANKSAGNSQ